MNFQSCIQTSIVFTALATGVMDRPEPLSAAISGDPARSAAIPSGYWQGELVAPGRSGKLALDVDASRADTVLLDMPSIWRIGLPLESFEQRGDSLFFDLPWGLGSVRARVDEGRIDGVALLFVLKELLGYEDVKNYDGSWTEYGSLVNAPVERDV